MAKLIGTKVTHSVHSRLTAVKTAFSDAASGASNHFSPTASILDESGRTPAPVMRRGMEADGESVRVGRPQERRAFISVRVPHVCLPA